MQKPRALSLFLAAALAADPAVAARASAQAAAQAPPTFAVGTSAVAIDVVVRDKKGQLVKDLTAADFEVTEDGAKQKVESFTVVARGVEALPERGAATPPTPAAAPAPAAEPAAVPTIETPDAPAVLALVFDRMSPGGRDIAHTAALTYLSARHEGDFVGVFAIDLALHTIQNFTADTDRIRTAIDLAATQAGTSFVSSADRARDLQTLTERAQDAENIAMAAGGQGSPGNPGTSNAAMALAGGAAAERDIARLQVGMMQNFESLERDQQGFATSNGLLAVAQGLQRVPGRKTIVFFSEGMAIPDRVLPQFEAVIAAANRANVAIYTMDAAGLRVHSPTESTRDEVNAAARTRMQNMGREDQGIMMKDAERNEDLLRLNPQSGLGQLAEQTGGFLVRDTNDARGSFRQIAQDMRFHYVIGYTPTNDNYDGRFRRVSVKVVRRGGMNVHSRRGYYALRAGTSNPVLPYEAPAVALLDRPGPHVELFPFKGAVLTFPQAGGTLKVPVLVRVPGAFPKYSPAPGQKDVLAADMAVVVRLRNEYHQEVGRVSQHYQLTAPAAKIDAARAGDILFYRETQLPPGKYTVDAVAYDAGASAASVKSFPLEVPAPHASGAVLSSLVVIDHVERVPAADRDPNNPLYFGEMLVYPSLGDPFRKSAVKALGFYFTARVPANARKGVMEILRSGQSVLRQPFDLPSPDASGLVRHALTVPTQALTPGGYEVRVDVMAGAERLASRTASFTVAE